MSYLKFQCMSFNSIKKFHCCKFLKAKDSGKNSKNKILPIKEAKDFVHNCLKKLGVHEDKAKTFAQSLVVADYKGIRSHGLNRLQNYINDIKTKSCDPNATPQIVKESASVATVAGHNGLGAVIAKFCMDLAIKKASETGMGMVVANGSNHFGINSYYTSLAANKGYIGITFTNTSPIMVPPGALKVVLGTNPISVAAPGEKGDSIVMDFATTAVAFGKIEVALRKGEKIPLSWALDESGKPTDDPKVALKARKLSPVGGNESHKGFGIAIMVELLSSVLADANIGPEVPFWAGGKRPKPANLGHGFIAIDPRKFAPNFEKRVSKLINYIRKVEPINPKRPVVIPGDFERAIMDRHDKQGGVEMSEKMVTTLEEISKKLGVNPPKYK